MAFWERWLPWLYAAFAFVVAVTVVALDLIPERYSFPAFVVGAMVIPGIAHYRYTRSEKRKQPCPTSGDETW